MSFQYPSPSSAYEDLQEWRRLERRLAGLTRDDPERQELERRVEGLRRRYQERFDALTRAPDAKPL